MVLRRIGALSVFVVFAVFPALATDYYADVAGGSWTSSSTWHLVSNSGPAAPAGTYPGSAAGDKAIIDFQGIVVTLTSAVPNAVTLDANNISCFVTVSSGGSVQLTGASQVAGGTILNLNGGTVTNTGTLTIANFSSIGWTSGTLTGSGTTTVNSGGAVNATGSSMILSGGQVLDLFGTFTYGAAASGLAVNSSASINIRSGALFDIQNSSGIGSDNAGNPTISVLSGGMFRKTNGNFGTNITPRLDNAGTVQTDINMLVLTNGTHTGTFNMNGAATGIGFSGTPALQNGTSITGTGTAFLGNVTVTGTVNATNLSMDSFGSISGGGTLNVSGTFDWRGGSISGGTTVNIPSGATLNVTGESNTTLTTTAHINLTALSGASNLNINPGVGSLAINSGGHITNGGNLNLLGDVTVGSDGASNARIDNTGTLSKSAGVASAVLNVIVNNGGTVSVSSGVLKLQRGGTQTGAWSMPVTGTGIAFDGGTHRFTAATFTGSTGTTTVALTNGTMDVDTNITLTNIAFQMQGGVLTGTGNLILNGSFLWSGGTMDASSGGGTVTSNGAGSLIAPSSAAALTSRTLNNAGTISYDSSAAALSINTAGLFSNTGTFNIVGDGAINSNGTSSPTFANGAGGVINKSTGAGTFTFNSAFNGNGGTINVSSGTITMAAGGQDLGGVNFTGATNKIALSNGIFTFANSPAINSTGAIVVSSPATMTLNAPVSIGNLEFLGGTINGPATLTITNSLLWRSGTMSGPGITSTTSTTTVSATSMTGVASINNRTFNNNGTFNWDGSQTLDIVAGGILTNNLTFNATGNGQLGSASGAVVNNANLSKTGGTSGTRIDAVLTNNGTFSSQVAGQSLIINGGGSQSGGGTLSGVAGAFIDFFGGTFTVSSGTSPFGGSGIFRVNGGTLAIAASMNILNPASLLVQSGALDVAGGGTFQVQTFQWTGGTLQNNGTTRVFGGFIGNSAPMTMLNNHTLTIPAASFNYNADAANFVSINGTANLNIESSATMFITGNGIIAGSSTDGVTVSGKLLKTGTGTARLDVPLIMANGVPPVTFGATGGTLQINGGGSSNVTCVLDLSGGSILFSGGVFDMGPNTAVTGTGTVGVSGGTLNANGNFTFPVYNQNGGTLGGTGLLQVNGGTWNGGSMSGTGSLTVGSGATFNIGLGAGTLARPLGNLGTLNVNGGFTMSGATLSNSSQLNLASGANLSGTTLIQNNAAGTLSLAGGGVNVNVPLNNDGTVTSNGSLNLLGGGTHTGDFTAGNNITFGGIHNFSATADLAGAGGYAFNGTCTLAGTYAAGSSLFNPGSTTTFNTTSAVALGTAFIDGNVGGTAVLNVTGAGSNWTNGVLSGPSSISIANTASFAITGAGSQSLVRPLANNGAVTLSTSLPGSGSIANFASFTANPAGAVTVGPAFNNQIAGATALFQSGTVAFNGGYTQTAGTTTLNAGSFSSPLTVNILGGSVTGNGTIGASVVNGGTFAAGLSAGLLTIGGNFTQTSTGAINAEIGGNTPGAGGYDRIAVTGNVTLAGTLSAVFINSWVPLDGDLYDLLTWGGTRTGTFTTANLPPYAFGTLTPSYEPNAYRLTIDAVGDVQIFKAGPATGVFGSNISFTITVTNNGPSPATGVVVTDPTPANLSFVSNSVDCLTAYPCNLGTLAAGATRIITSTYTITGGAGTNITNTATVSSTSTDNVATNNTGSVTFFVELADLGISKAGPATVLPGQDVTFTITVANGGSSAAQNVVVTDPTPAGLTFLGNAGACTTPFPCSLGTIGSGQSVTIQATYSIDGSLAGGTVTNSATVSTTTTDDPANNTATVTIAVDCLNTSPDALSPTGTAAASGTLSWRGRGDSYIVYFGPAGTGCSTHFATTTGKSISYTGLEEGKTYEWRVESIVNGCPTRTSTCVSFKVPVVPPDCRVPDAPLARVVGQATSAKTYSVEWDAVTGAVRYEIDEADNPDFAGATRFSLTERSKTFKHDAPTEPVAFYYRVRAFTDCVQTPGPDSPTVRVVIIPLPPPNTLRKNVNVPAGSEELIIQQYFIAGQPGKNPTFHATTDRPWLTVRPSDGILPPDGVTLEVIADPKNLPNGTFTASVIVTITDGTSNLRVNATTTTTVPISMNLVTPVTPVAAKPGTSPYALVIPTAGHLDGIGSHWQSDVRVTNAGFKSARYRLTFTPSTGTASGVRQTDVTIDAGATTALDDIISNWFGLGTLGDGANGMLEIVPLDDPATTAQTTVASSRTYNVTGNGTLGQYIPAIPFPSFIGRALPGTQAQVLSLQQIAQNASYRTNVGLAEASGAPVTALLTVLSSSGAKLKDIPVQLNAGQQLQMNQLLALNGIELNDGRIEVKVTGGDGKVTAYASVVDSTTQDPLLVSGEPLSGSANKYVVAGVANLQNPVANWQTDMRVFNFGTSSQPATLTFFPLNNGPSRSVNVLLGAGQIMTLDNILKSQFNVENDGGMVQLTTNQASSLIVSGRTYNQTANGTYGQFVPAVTADDAVGMGGRTLHILQVEDSTRYRTNVGLAEVSGRPVTLEMQIVLPDSKITPTVQIPLAANEFRQFNPIRDLGVGNAYNARISVRVIGGDGRVTAYGSVIDEVTQDPTYVPAQ